MKTKEKVWKDVLHKNRIAFILFCVMSLLNGAIFYLYGIMNESFLYSEVLVLALFIVFLLFDYLFEFVKAKAREDMKSAVFVKDIEVNQNSSYLEQDYEEIIVKLKEEIHHLTCEMADQQSNDEDYYTSWVHQIKTPIAVMKLELTEDNETNRVLLGELFRIEQYVEMVLNYGRLRSNSTDLLIKEYELDSIISEVLHKFAPQFILKKLKLNYAPSHDTVITDKKWLSFIIEQLVSNAVKYTPNGEITIFADSQKIIIEDTGIGIDEADLPRIFEKGYTGMNGRLGQKSSGLGLFLANKAVKLLNMKIECNSFVGKGSTFVLHFRKSRQ